MERYKVILAYDGTHFQGFQRQAHGRPVVEARTVQSEIEAALRNLEWRGKAVLTAGRTDTGVHASGQVIAFDLEWRHSLADLQRAFNAHLPSDVAVRAVGLAPANFHPRYAAASRSYQYRLFCDPARHPLVERYAWRIWPAVDLERMQLAASYLVGRHDFSAFGTPLRANGSTIRTIYQAGWISDGKVLEFTICGNAFLYHMVRRLVFIQVEIGQGRLEPDMILRYLAEGRKLPQQGLAPAQGLTLVKVSFKDHFGEPSADHDFGETDCAENIHTESK
jgi:tRNA pseudouridine38-40 synthase